MSDWQIGPVRLDVQRRALCRDEQQCYLEPRVFALLEALLLAEQQLLSHEQLVAQVWQGRVVSDSAIHRAVSLLRKAFASLDDSQPYLETYAKVGYRLVEPATKLGAEVMLPTAIVVDVDTHDAMNTASTANTANIAKHPDAEIETGAAMPGASAEKNTFSPQTLMFSGLFLGLLLLVIGGWYFYNSAANRDVQQPIYAVAKPLSSDPGAESKLSASADGRFLLYQHTSNNKQSWWLQQLPGQDRTELKVARGYDQMGVSHLLLSPAADALLYQYCHNGRCQLHLHQLQENFTLDPLADPALLPYPQDSELQWQWQADGQGFYFLQRDDKTKPYHSFFYRIATKALRQLTVRASAPGDSALAVSPDGKQLVVASYQQQQQSLLSIISTDTLQTQREQQVPYTVTSMVWHQQQLWFGCGSELCRWVLDHKIDSSVPDRLSHSKAAPVFTPPAAIQSMVSLPGQLVFAVVSQRSSIWRQQLNADPTEAALVQSSRQEFMPRPAGQDLVFLSNRSGKAEIWLKDQSQQEKLLATLPEPAGFVALAVSPSGDDIAFSHQGALYLLNKNNSKLSQLLGVDAKAGPVRFAPDGASLLFGSEKSGDWQLWSYRRADKKLQQLTTQGGYSGYWWQGKLLYSKYHQDGLFLKTPDSDNEQLLLDDFDKINWLNWQLDGDNLYFFRPQQGVFQLDLSLTAEQPRLQPQPLTAQQAKLIFAAPPGFVHHYQLANDVIWYVKREAAEGDIYQLAVP